MSLQEVIYFLKKCQSALTINNLNHEFGSQQFEKAAIDVTNLKEQPGSDDLLEIYALFKQSTVGDVNTSECIFIGAAIVWITLFFIRRAVLFLIFSV